MKKATFIRTLDDFTGVAKLYKLSEPHEGHEHVVVSALTSAFDTGEPETYIFPATYNGDIIDWGELIGSYRGGTSHAKALRNAGYDLD